MLTDTFLDNAETEANGMIDLTEEDDPMYDNQRDINRLAAHAIALVKDSRKIRSELSRLRSLESRLTDVEKIEDLIEEHLAITLGIPMEWYKESHVKEVTEFAKAFIRYVNGEECTISDSP